MKFGLFLAAQYFPGDSIAQRLHELLEQVRVARDAGFDLIAAGQHYLSDPYQMLQPIPLLARVAAEAGSMKIASTVILLPLQNPVDMAEQVATMDAICEGRFVFGVGLGYREEEYAAFGVPRAERVSRFEESLDVMKRLWTEGDIEYHGKHFDIPMTRLTLRSVQRPYPPIWIAANNDLAVQRAARLGHAWAMNPHATLNTLAVQTSLFLKTLKQFGHPDTIEKPLLRELYIHKTARMALNEAKPYIVEKYRAYAAWGQDKAMPGGERFDVPFERLVKDRFIVGGPDECIEEIHRYREHIGNTHLVIRMQWPGMPNSSVLRQIELLGKRVIPEFK